MLTCVTLQLVPCRAVGEVTAVQLSKHVTSLADLESEDPLAVKNPYLSTWVPGYQMNDSAHARPEFWAGQSLTWVSRVTMLSIEPGPNIPATRSC